jgi:hypothetical protein
MTATITERVAAGAAFLDEHDPQWWRPDVERAIDLDRLDLGSGGRCILGQRCPLEGPSPFTRQSEAMSGFSWEDDEEALDRWATRYGFDAGDVQYAELTAEWKRVITGRRSS